MQKRKERIVVTEDQRRLFDTIMNNLKQIGKRGGGKFTGSVPINLLWVDPEYQRLDTRSEDKIRRLANHWDENKLTPIILVPHCEEARFAVVDGYGRLSASQMLADKYSQLDAIVLTNVPEDKKERQKFEASIFVEQDKDIEIVKPIQKHNARVLLGDQAAITIEKMCERYKITFTAKKGRRHEAVLGSYSDAYDIARIHGAKCLEFILDVIQNAGWRSESNGYSTYVMRALRDTWCAHPTKRKEIAECLSEELRQIDPQSFKAISVARYPAREYKVACVLYMEDLLCNKLHLERKIYDDGKRAKIIAL